MQKTKNDYGAANHERWRVITMTGNLVGCDNKLGEDTDEPAGRLGTATHLL